MLGTDTVLRLRERLSSYDGDDIISLYLDVDRTDPDNADKAWALRARAAMEELQLEPRTVQRITDQLRQKLAMVGGPIAAVFVHPSDEELFEMLSLERDMPALSLDDGVSAHLGDPMLAPLQLATMQRPTTLGLLLGQERIRTFVIKPAEVEELSSAIQMADEEKWPEMGEGRGTSNLARSGPGTERYDDRVEAWTARLRKRVADEVPRTLKNHGATSILLMGTEPAIAAFEAELDDKSRALVGARASSFPDPDASVSTLRNEMLELADEAQQVGTLALLHQANERGVRGLAETLEAVDEGRVYLLLVPSQPDVQVQRLERSGHVYAHGAAKYSVTNEKVEQVALVDVLPDLAERNGMELRFVTGDEGEEWLQEMGGLAGLLRW